MAHRQRPEAAEDRSDKTCASCGRRIQWRAKWANNWDAVRYCSAACRRRGVTPIDEKLEADILARLANGRAITIGDDEPERRAARRLVARSDGEIELTQNGRFVDPSTAKGPFQLTRTSFMSMWEEDRIGPYLRADELRAVDDWFSREERYALGTDLVTGRCYVSFPVNASAVGYEEYYEVDAETYARYLANPALALPFVNECRRHEHDNLIMVKPGWNRGTPD